MINVGNGKNNLQLQFVKLYLSDLPYRYRNKSRIMSTDQENLNGLFTDTSLRIFGEYFEKRGSQDLSKHLTYKSPAITQKVNLKMGVSRKQSTPHFPKNEHFVTTDTHT